MTLSNSKDDPEVEKMVFSQSVLGPFETLVAISGFDLRPGSEPRKTNKCLRFLSTAICIFVIVCFAYLFFAQLFDHAQPLTFKWTDGNMYLFLIGYAVVSAIAIAGWTKSKFVEQFQEDMGTLRNLRINAEPKIDNYTKIFNKSIIYSTIVVAAWCLAGLRDVIYEPITEDNNSTIQIVECGDLVRPGRLFGFQPLLFAWMGIASAAATVVYALVQIQLTREITYFNEELQKSSDNQKLHDFHVLDTFAKRHHLIMKLVTFTNNNLGKFSIANSVFCTVAMMNSIIMVNIFLPEVTLLYKISTFSWLFITIGFMIITMGQPGHVCAAIKQTAQIITSDQTISSSQDSNIISSSRFFIDRCEKFDHMFIANAVKMDDRCVHLALLLMPNIATIIAMIKKLLIGDH